ncbi:hypothetical protein J3F83DRAFT_387070 [Trichoderma novae-zelandiae]
MVTKSRAWGGRFRKALRESRGSCLSSNRALWVSPFQSQRHAKHVVVAKLDTSCESTASAEIDPRMSDHQRTQQGGKGLVDFAVGLLRNFSSEKLAGLLITGPARRQSTTMRPIPRCRPNIDTHRHSSTYSVVGRETPSAGEGGVTRTAGDTTSSQRTRALARGSRSGPVRFGHRLAGSHENKSIETRSGWLVVPADSTPKAPEESNAVPKETAQMSGPGREKESRNVRNVRIV